MLDTYISLFSSLNTARKSGKNAPHKAILLLSIMELVEVGHIQSTKIVLDNQLESTFNRLWKRYIGASLFFSPKVATPFWHMQNEPFYNLYHNDGSPTVLSRPNYSIPYLRSNTYAIIDDELLSLMKGESSRAELRVTLISTYLRGQHDNGETLVLLLPLLVPLLNIAV